MVAFHNLVDGEPVANWWDNGYQAIAFSRGNKGFLAINNEDHAINQKLQTGLPSGRYCDVISGDLVDNRCSGSMLEVDKDGFAQVSISNTLEDPMVAIHILSKLRD